WRRWPRRHGRGGRYGCNGVWEGRGGTVTSRRSLGLLTCLIALLAAGLTFPLWRWELVGRLRGESTFRGRPTSYWRAELLGKPSPRTAMSRLTRLMSEPRIQRCSMASFLKAVRNLTPTAACLAMLLGGQARAADAAFARKTYTYKTVGTTQIQADVYRPNDQK